MTWLTVEAVWLFMQSKHQKSNLEASGKKSCRDPTVDRKTDELYIILEKDRHIGKKTLMSLTHSSKFQQKYRRGCSC